MPKYPDIHVQLTGNDGNAFAILGAVDEALKDAGIDDDERDEFQVAAQSGDYNNRLRTAMAWVAVA